MRILSFLSRLKLNQLLHISRFKALLAKSFFLSFVHISRTGLKMAAFSVGVSSSIKRNAKYRRHQLSRISIFTNTVTSSVVFWFSQIQTKPTKSYFDFHKYRHQLSCISIFTNTDEISSVVVRFSQKKTPAQLYFDFYKYRWYFLTCIWKFTSTDTSWHLFQFTQIQTTPARLGCILIFTITSIAHQIQNKDLISVLIHYFSLIVNYMLTFPSLIFGALFSD